MKMMCICPLHFSKVSLYSCWWSWWRCGKLLYSLYNYPREKKKKPQNAFRERLECAEGCCFPYFPTLKHAIAMIRNNLWHKPFFFVFLSIRYKACNCSVSRPPARRSLIILLTFFFSSPSLINTVAASWSVNNPYSQRCSRSLIDSAGGVIQEILSTNWPAGFLP